MCDEMRAAEMRVDPTRPDGLSTICLRCERQQNRERVRRRRDSTRQHAYRTVGLDCPGFVYSAYDTDGRLLYVGETNNLFRRFFWPSKGHADSSSWWPLAVRMTVSVYRTKRDAQTAEAFLIERLQPPFNRKRGARRSEVEPTPVHTYSGDLHMSTPPPTGPLPLHPTTKETA